MSVDSSSDVKFQIGNVLFIDIVGYSKLMITEQSDQLQTLRQIVGIREEVRARVCAHLGDKECAITSLERLLSAPSDGIFGPPVTRAILKLDPMFDPLRGDPRFEKLCQDPAK